MKPDLKYRQCISIQNASTKITHLLRIEYVPPTFTSADQTENYDSNDSVAYGEMFTAVTFKPFEELEFLNRRTSAHPTSSCVGIEQKVKQKVE